MIESLALRRRLDDMGPNARPQRTVTPVQRSNGVSPTPNPRGVEGRETGPLAVPTRTGIEDRAHPTLSLSVPHPPRNLESRSTTYASLSVPEPLESRLELHEWSGC